MTLSDLEETRGIGVEVASGGLNDDSASVRDRPRVAYLVNQYPQTSQSFIRREAAALEAGGLAVERYTVREGSADLVDPLDVAERGRTRVVLKEGAVGLIGALLRLAVSRPSALARAARLAVQVGRRSERGVPVHLVYLAEACVLWRWFRENEIGHVHAHFGTNSTTVAMFCEALGGPPYSFTVHGPEEFDKPLSIALGEKVRRAAFVVAISEYGRSQIYRWAPRGDWGKVHVVRCGLDAPFFEGPLTPPTSARRLVCVGRLVEQKGQPILIDAAAKLRDEGVDFELVLVGDGPLREELEGQIAAHALGGRVRLVGWQSNAAVRGWLRDSRALVLPSFAEGLPVVIMEALAVGRPVISTLIAGIPELVRPGESGWLVTPGSVEALAGAMREALDAPDEVLIRMGRAGASRAAEMHDAAQESALLAALFCEYSGRHSSSERPPTAS